MSSGQRILVGVVIVVAQQLRARSNQGLHDEVTGSQNAEFIAEPKRTFHEARLWMQTPLALQQDLFVHRLPHGNIKGSHNTERFAHGTTKGLPLLGRCARREA
jgi:hypothetical protein